MERQPMRLKDGPRPEFILGPAVGRTRGPGWIGTMIRVSVRAGTSVVELARTGRKPV
jgi:hypothetical protein